MRTPIAYLLSYEGKNIFYNDLAIPFQSDIAIDLSGADFFYPDFCVIYRGTGTVNTSGDEIFTGTHYGLCGFDLDRNMKISGFHYSSDPVIIIPTTEIDVKINDKVLVSLGVRLIEASVKQFEIQKEEGLSGTTVWLKLGTDE